MTKEEIDKLPIIFTDEADEEIDLTGLTEEELKAIEEMNANPMQMPPFGTFTEDFFETPDNSFGKK